MDASRDQVWEWEMSSQLSDHHLLFYFIYLFIFFFFLHINSNIDALKF